MTHETAKMKDAREILRTGQVLLGVIIEADVDEDGTALTKHNNIKIFVKQKGEDLEWGDTVLMKIIDVGESHAESLAISTLD